MTRLIMVLLEIAVAYSGLGIFIDLRKSKF
ncbi:hypothetical protein SAMN05443529_102306 [Desulfosporosinus hippei DSM 8344]|uniref:Uncharacterized protein n=1 Tax=Desulfosporosinus hippei DSM 8344 TaxID=1121419 RepID=A0A1G7TP55_9FIRM|nr:hypothetical protein SAMN05443529_102306 [Desulfosporosinus hippei DSM 8344]